MGWLFGLGMGFAAGLWFAAYTPPFAWMMIALAWTFCAAPFAWRALAKRLFGQDGGW